MTKEEMLAAVETNVTKLGNQGAINLSPLLNAMIEQLFAAGQAGGDAPIVVKIAARGTEDGTRTTYELTTAQRDIDGYIAAANKGKESTRLFVEDNGALIGFPFLEIDELSVTGKGVLCDGEFGVVLSKSPGKSYFWHDAKVEAIPPVTAGQIEAYNKFFESTYDRVNDKFKIIIGATEFSLSPADMLIVAEEYNKRSVSGDYTGMWARSVSRYICCNPWLDAYNTPHKLTKAFLDCKTVEFIDLNTPHKNLSVVNLNNTFAGCERLEQISGVIDLKNCPDATEAFRRCFKLQVVKLSNANYDIDLSDCIQLAPESLKHLMEFSFSQKEFNVFLAKNIYDEIEKSSQDPDTKWGWVHSMQQNRPRIKLNWK